MKSVRLFNANTLFKVSLIMIVMVAAIYVIGFLVGLCRRYCIFRP